MTRQEFAENLDWIEDLLKRAKNGGLSETTWGFLFVRLAAMRRLAEELES